MTAKQEGKLHRIEGDIHVCYAVPDGSFLKASPVKALHDAAPELLEALETLLREVDHKRYSIRRDRAFFAADAAARAAIAKATQL